MASEYGSGWPKPPTHYPWFMDFTGNRFGKLLVVSYGGQRPVTDSVFKTSWICHCDCGRWRVCDAQALRRGATSSCGCVRDALRTIHGHSKPATRTYRIWMGMKRRCLRPRDTSYKNYGGRGIQLCDRWHQFDKFLADMGEPTSEKHQIDRIDNDGDYEPGNCRWATPQEQMQNTRRSRILEFRGRKKSLTAWADEIGIAGWALQGRIKNGWPTDLALTQPVVRGGNRQWRKLIPKPKR